MHTGELKYHIVWCTKYRRPILDEDVAERLKRLVFEKAIVKKFTVYAIEVMPDHVHLFIGAKASISLKYIANQVKGYTSSVLRKEFENLRTKVPTLWTRSYYAGTIGHVSEETVKKYIESQKTR